MTSLQDRAFLKRGKTLVPADFMSEDALDGIPEGAEVLVRVRRARSVANHRHFWAILHRAINALPDEYRMLDEDALLDAIKLAVGHVRRVRKLNGDIVELPASIDFASLDESKFQRFKQRALYVLGRIIGCDPCELEPDEPKRRAA